MRSWPPESTAEIVQFPSGNDDARLDNWLKRNNGSQPALPVAQPQPIPQKQAEPAEYLKQESDRWSDAVCAHPFSPAVKLVAWAISRGFNQEYFSAKGRLKTPSKVATLAKRVGLARRTVFLGIKTLEEHGFIRIVRQRRDDGGKRSSYYLALFPRSKP
jgi:hypothetical protein